MDGDELKTQRLFRFGGRFAKRREQIVDGLVGRGCTEVESVAAVAQIGDASLIKWWMDHQGDIKAIIDLLLKLFGDD